MYNIARNKGVSVQSVLLTNQLNINFRRALIGNNLRAWHNLVATVMNVNLVNRPDSFRWALHQNGLFSVRSMYRALMVTQALPYSLHIWKIKISLKIKIFMWYLYKGVTLTKDNLVRKNWKGSVKCCFCNLSENIQHLFFDCPMARFVWRTIFIALNIAPPRDFQNMFADWLGNIDAKFKRIIWMGAATICWAMWLSRNDIIFNNMPIPSFLQVLFMGTYWARF